MIDVIVTSGCPHCPRQIAVMSESFRPEDYRVIHEGSKEFEEHELNKQVDGFPFLVIRDAGGHVRYAAAGYMDAKQLDARIAKYSGPPKEFNLRKARMGI